MSKKIYAYFNDRDIEDIFELFSDSNFVITDSDGESVDRIPTISISGVNEYHICFGTDYILFGTCSNSSDLIQPGYFVLNNDTGQAEKWFKIIKEYIKKSFFYSSNLKLYVGKGSYDDWLNKRYIFPLIDCDKFETKSFITKSVLENLVSIDCVAKPQFCKLGDSDIINEHTESFIIHKNDSKLISTIIRKSFIRYECGSECIFVIKNKNKKDTFTFYLDSRLENSDISKLFYIVKKGVCDL
jgi:hypothetical protein